MIIFESIWTILKKSVIFEAAGVVLVCNWLKPKTKSSLNSKSMENCT